MVSANASYPANSSACGLEDANVVTTGTRACAPSLGLLDIPYEATSLAMQSQAPLTMRLLKRSPLPMETVPEQLDRKYKHHTDLVGNYPKGIQWTSPHSRIDHTEKQRKWGWRQWADFHGGYSDIKEQVDHYHGKLQRAESTDQKAKAARSAGYWLQKAKEHAPSEQQFDADMGEVLKSLHETANRNKKPRTGEPSTSTGWQKRAVTNESYRAFIENIGNKVDHHHAMAQNHKGAESINSKGKRIDHAQSRRKWAEREKDIETLNHGGAMGHAWHYEDKAASKEIDEAKRAKARSNAEHWREVETIAGHLSNPRNPWGSKEAKEQGKLSLEAKLKEQQAAIEAKAQYHQKKMIETISSGFVSIKPKSGKRTSHSLQSDKWGERERSIKENDYAGLKKQATYYEEKVLTSGNKEVRNKARANNELWQHRADTAYPEYAKKFKSFSH